MSKNNKEIETALAVFGNPSSPLSVYFVLTNAECEEFAQVGYFAMMERKLKNISAKVDED